MVLEIEKSPSEFLERGLDISLMLLLKRVMGSYILPGFERGSAARAVEIAGHGVVKLLRHAVRVQQVLNIGGTTIDPGNVPTLLALLIWAAYYVSLYRFSPLCNSFGVAHNRISFTI